jgi:uncharacterized cofD-like protein
MQDSLPTGKPLRLVLLGGGTGMHCLLHGMVYWSRVHMPLDITGIVCTSDDGGSTGIIREELCMPAPGDIRNALEGICSALALSERTLSVTPADGQAGTDSSRQVASALEIATWWPLLSHRLGQWRERAAWTGASISVHSTLAGHALGNLLLASLYERHDAQWSRAVHAACSMLGIPSNLCRLWPASNDLLQLVGEKASSTTGDSGRETIIGESRFAQTPGRLWKIWIECLSRAGSTSSELAQPLDGDPSEPTACPEALDAIHNADAIILGPGSLYTSIAAVVAIPSIRRALAQWSQMTSPARAPIYVCNLWTEPGETDGMDVLAHIDALCAILDELDNDMTPSGQPRIPLRVLMDVSQLLNGPVEVSATSSMDTLHAAKRPSAALVTLSSTPSVQSSVDDAAAPRWRIHVDQVRLEDKPTSLNESGPTRSKPAGHDPHRLTRALLRLLLHRRHVSSADSIPKSP